jgi:hypothetical protein
MVTSIEIFDTRVEKIEPAWTLSKIRKSSYLKFKPNPIELPQTDAGIFTFEVKLTSKSDLLLTSAFFCGKY